MKNEYKIAIIGSVVACMLPFFLTPVQKRINRHSVLPDRVDNVSDSVAKNCKEIKARATVHDVRMNDSLFNEKMSLMIEYLKKINDEQKESNISLNQLNTRVSRLEGAINKNNGLYQTFIGLLDKGKDSTMPAFCFIISE